MKTLRRLFLAGKITGNDWRRQLVRGELVLHARRQEECLIKQACVTEGFTFPVREHGVLSLLDYVGPYYVNPDEGTCQCSSSSHNHGAWHYDLKRAVMRANLRALEAADVVFAWVDDASAVGTAYELGYARALGKEIWMASPRYVEEFGLLYPTALCSVMEPEEGYEDHGLDSDPRAAFVRVLWDRLSSAYDRMTIDPGLLSPIESRFLCAWNAANRDDVYAPEPYLGLYPQYPVVGGHYRLDFAYLEPARFSGQQIKVAIELDGLRAHSTTDQIASDRRRQRHLEALGWRVIRFGGKEIHQNAEACVAEARHVIVQMRDQVRADDCRAYFGSHSHGPQSGPILDESAPALADDGWAHDQGSAAAR